MEKVSCVLCTNRPGMVEHALSLFSSLAWPDKELVLVEDEGSEYAGAVPPGTVRKSTPPGMPLGIKMGIGASAATGSVIHKFDDDDYYSPLFLDRAMKELGKGVDLCWWSTYLLYFAKSNTLRVIHNGRAGGSFVFRSSLLSHFSFRPLPSGIDTAFYTDALANKTAMSAISDSPGLFAYVRHGDNLWQLSPGVVNGRPASFDVDSVLVSLSSPYIPYFYKSVGEVIPEADRAFYRTYTQSHPSHPSQPSEASNVL
jgi:hypothetical protein